MNQKQFIVHCIVFLMLTACSEFSNADTVATEIMVTNDGFAIKGYDPVSYFTEGKPSKGSLEFSTEWQDAIWLFTSATHRDTFIQNPEKYTPEYGGWCAYGMAKAYAAETDPLNAWTIHDGKLYLNWDQEVAKDWSKDIDGYLTQSEKNWPTVQDQLKNGKAEIYWHEE